MTEKKKEPAVAPASSKDMCKDESAHTDILSQIAKTVTALKDTGFNTLQATAHDRAAISFIDDASTLKWLRTLKEFQIKGTGLKTFDATDYFVEVGTEVEGVFVYTVIKLQQLAEWRPQIGADAK